VSLRSSNFALFALFALVSLESSAAPEAPELQAEIGCRAEPSTRRVMCNVTLAAAPSRRLAWSDALVLEAPDASPPLRARVPSRSDSPERIVVSFVLGEAGGSVELLARAVDCPVAPVAGACRSLTRALSVELPALASP
jgi:hypothetical protein